MYRINEFLTPSERLDAMRLGGLKALVANGLTPSTFTKEAAGNPPAPSPDFLKSVMMTSVVLGLPIGAVWYALSSGIRKSDEKTQRMRAELDHYNDVVSSYRNRLSGGEDA